MYYFHCQSEETNSTMKRQRGMEKQFKMVNKESFVHAVRCAFAWIIIIIAPNIEWALLYLVYGRRNEKSFFCTINFHPFIILDLIIFNSLNNKEKRRRANLCLSHILCECNRFPVFSILSHLPFSKWTNMNFKKSHIFCLNAWNWK